MRRRDFIKVFGVAAAGWPFAARAQQTKMPVIGFVNAASPQTDARQLAAFLKGLSEAGYVDGRSVTIEYRWAEGRNDRLPAMVVDLVHRKVAMIATTGSPAVLAAKAATKTIPIVFEIGDDPVRLGLVTSLSRPDGNITGVTQTNVEVTPKRLQLLHELVPTASVMALLVDPSAPTLAEIQSNEVLAAARTLGLQLHVLNASAEHDLDAVFVKLKQLRVGGLVIGGAQFLSSQSERLAALTVRHAVPTIFQYRDFVVAGGLLSYGADVTSAYRITGNYTGRILKGAKPPDLPVQQVNKVELYINLKTAKALGLTVPLTLLGRADEVIE
jgi:putative tryptophan/tyrosine transport system substrate-binding protein